MRFQKYPDTCGRGLNLSTEYIEGNFRSFAIIPKQALSAEPFLILFLADKTSSQAVASAAILKNFSSDADIIVGKQLGPNEVSNWYSIFPVENKELIYGRWEDKVIWDDQVISLPFLSLLLQFRELCC